MATGVASAHTVSSHIAMTTTASHPLSTKDNSTTTATATMTFFDRTEHGGALPPSKTSADSELKTLTENSDEAEDRTDVSRATMVAMGTMDKDQGASYAEGGAGASRDSSLFDREFTDCLAIANDDRGHFGAEGKGSDCFVLSPKLLTSVTGVSDLSQVTYLELCLDSRQQGLNNFGSFLPGLKQLKLNGSRIESLRELGTRLSSLQVLYVSSCELQSLDGLSNMENIRELHAAFNFIADLTPLCFGEELRVIDLEANLITEITQIGFLAMCPYLHTLTLIGNPCCLRPSASGPEPGPGYDYGATVRQFMPGLGMLDDQPTQPARRAIAALQRPHSAMRSRPQSAMGKLSVGGLAEFSRRPRSSTGSRPIADQSQTDVSRQLTSPPSDLASLDEGQDATDDGEEEAVVQSGEATINLSGSILQGSLAQALRSRKQQRPAPGTPGVTAAPVVTRAPITDHGNAPSAVSNTTTVSSEVDRGPNSNASLQLKKVTPVFTDPNKERSAAFEELRQWRETFSQGQSLLTQATQLSPVRDEAAARLDKSRSGHSSSSPHPYDPGNESALMDSTTGSWGQDTAMAGQSQPSAGGNKATGRRKLPREPNPPSDLVVPTPPKGPPPAHRRLRPLTARASLQHIPASNPPRQLPSRPPRRPEKIEPYVRASTEAQAPRLPRHWLGGRDARPSTAAGRSSGLVP